MREENLLTEEGEEIRMMAVKSVSPKKKYNPEIMEIIQRSTNNSKVYNYVDGVMT